MRASLIRFSSRLILQHGKWIPVSSAASTSLSRRSPGYTYTGPITITAEPVVEVVPPSAEVIKENITRSVLGVPIPTKPVPPAEGECCQSGCARCTYDVYIEDVEDYHERLALARSQILAQNIPIADSDWPVELGSREAPSGIDAKEAAKQEFAARMKEIDPATRAFLEFEAKMKEKKRKKVAAALMASSSSL